MKYWVCAILLLSVFFNTGFAQKEMEIWLWVRNPVRYANTENLIKMDSQGEYYRVSIANKNHTVYLPYSFPQFQLFNENNNLILEGQIMGFCPAVRLGLWLEYYDNGKIKTEGSFFSDHPEGRWYYYFPNGNLKGILDYNIQGKQEGIFNEYYPNGNPKIIGNYILGKGTEDVVVYDKETGEEKIIKVETDNASIKDGIWYYYNNDGSIEKTEEYSN